MLENITNRIKERFEKAKMLIEDSLSNIAKLINKNFYNDFVLFNLKIFMDSESKIFIISLFIIVTIAGIKIFSFYNLMNISKNIFIMWLITCGLTAFLFSSFKNNKWIPAILYLFLSLLLFADAAYSSFFNRYLSISVMGEAGLLGGVGESLKSAVKPVFFMLFTDNILIFIYLYFFRRKNKHKIKTYDNFETLNKANPFSLRTYSKQLIALIMILVLSFGGPFNIIVASVNNQEFYSYHVKDAISNIYKNNEEAINKDNLLLSTGSYENEIDGPLFGIAKGRNLIVIQVESLQNMVVSKKYNGQDITPNLNKLINDKSTIYFDNYYEQRGSGNTSDAEFASNNSIYGTIESYTYKIYANNYFRGLPWQLKALGYQTAAFHGFEKDFWNRAGAYPAQGFDTFYSQDNFNNSKKLGMGIDDTEFFRQTTDYLKSMNQPFYSFVVTLSNHFPFYMPPKYIKIKLKAEDENTIFGNYLNSVNHTDEAIGQFIEELKAAGLYDNSIIAIYGDHFGLTPNDKAINESISRFVGKPYTYDTMMNVPFLIHIPNAEVNQRVSISGGQLDFLPTMSYLLGLEKLNTLYFGQNLLTAKSGFVCEQPYMPKGSFIQDDIIFEMSKDGVFANSKAWNFKTGESVPIEECKDGYLRSMNIIDLSEFYLKNNVLEKFLVEKMTAEEIMKSLDIIVPPKKIAVSGAPNVQLIYTNSKEGLLASYEKGNKYIKLNFTLADDKSSKVVAKDGYTSMNLSDLDAIMKQNDDLYIIAVQDINIENLLANINKEYPEMKNRIIPEINALDKYWLALFNGYPNAILRIDPGVYTNSEVENFIEIHKVFATSLPEDMISKEIKALIKKGKMVYKQSKFYDILL
jgi:phosphoglycerol transferase MdoB-like AlkP superfamily enzyme